MNLTTKIQNYDWGKRGTSSFIAQLVRGKNGSQEIEENVPYAELWMGTHPNGPSTIISTNKKLSDYIEENPNCLGEKVISKFGNQLPYLFKVLSIVKALSIQAHPDKRQMFIQHQTQSTINSYRSITNSYNDLAEKLYKSRPDLYKDSNHKPELAIAITPFEALCGFRPYQEIKLFLQTIPELIAVIGAENVVLFLSSDEVGLSKALQNCFKSLMTQKSDLISSQLQLLLSRVASLDESTRSLQLASLVERLNEQFPNDVGCFVVYFLNYLKLSPNEALYLGANEPHAYLSGDCIECMACSDNVVRAGLTPKFKDVHTLCNMLSYRMEPSNAKIFRSVRENDFTELYAPAIEDFAVAKIEQVVKNKKDIELIPRASASILLVLNGEGKCDHIVLNKGSVVFLDANSLSKITDMTSDFILFQAFANV